MVGIFSNFQKNEKLRPGTRTFVLEIVVFLLFSALPVWQRHKENHIQRLHQQRIDLVQQHRQCPVNSLSHGRSQAWSTKGVVCLSEEKSSQQGSESGTAGWFSCGSVSISSRRSKYYRKSPLHFLNLHKHYNSK